MSKKKIEEPLEKIINEHWDYIKAFLVAHNEPVHTIRKIEYHYKTAFEHGWKHRKELEK